MTSRVDAYLATLARVTREAEVTDQTGARLELAAGLERFGIAARTAHRVGDKLIFIGNGGSAAIASHLAIDYSKNGQLRALAFNDASALTCLANDFGYEHVFARQLEFHGRPRDMLIAISSSGSSANILAAVATARTLGLMVVTMSGFEDDNPLRKSGDVNFYVRSREYGFVEIGHLSLCHAALDIHLGWGCPRGRG